MEEKVRRRVAVYRRKKAGEEADFFDIFPRKILKHSKGNAPIAVSPARYKPLTAEVRDVILKVGKEYREGG